MTSSIFWFSSVVSFFKQHEQHTAKTLSNTFSQTDVGMDVINLVKLLKKKI